MRLSGLGERVGLVDLDFDGAGAHDVEEGAGGFLKLGAGSRCNRREWAA